MYPSLEQPNANQMTFKKQVPPSEAYSPRHSA